MAPETPAYMQSMGGGGNQYSQLADALMTDHNVERTQLTEGRVPEGAEVLVVADPQQLNDKQVFAIDQFLMQGGTVMLAAAPLAPSLTQQSLTAAPRNTGLEDWLAFQGIDIRPSFVMDPQNAAFPVPVTRQVGGFSFQEDPHARLSVLRRRTRRGQKFEFADHVGRAASHDAVGIADRRRCDEERADAR